MTAKQAFNPYLPSWEYVPDAEPHIVNGRVYVYGSHDLFNGLNFCLGDSMYAGPLRWMIWAIGRITAASTSGNRIPPPPKSA